MPTVEERLAYLEGRGEYQGVSITDLRTSIGEVRADIRDLRGEMRDMRSEIGDLRGEISGLRGEMNRRFEAVDTKFTWVIGIQGACSS